MKIFQLLQNVYRHYTYVYRYEMFCNLCIRYASLNENDVKHETDAKIKLPDIGNLKTSFLNKYSDFPLDLYYVM